MIAVRVAVSLPWRSGRSRQGVAELGTRRHPFTNRRSSVPGRPGSLALPGSSEPIRHQANHIRPLLISASTKPAAASEVVYSDQQERTPCKRWIVRVQASPASSPFMPCLGRQSPGIAYPRLFPRIAGQIPSAAQIRGSTHDAPQGIAGHYGAAGPFNAPGCAGPSRRAGHRRCSSPTAP